MSGSMERCWLAVSMVCPFKHALHVGHNATPHLNTGSSLDHDPGSLHDKSPGAQTLHGSRDPGSHRPGHVPVPYQADWSAWGQPMGMRISVSIAHQAQSMVSLTFRFLPRKTLSFRTSA